MTPEALAAIAAPTPGAKWREEGQPDPFGNRYDFPRDTLHMGGMTDDELANAVFLYGNRSFPSLEEINAGVKPPIVWLTAAKDRIRWLSRREATLLAEVARLQAALAEAEKRVWNPALVEDAFCEGFCDGIDGTWVEGDYTPAWKRSGTKVLMELMVKEGDKVSQVLE